jgi:hypothetical protein
VLAIIGALIILYGLFRGWQTYRHIAQLRTHVYSLKALGPDDLASVGTTLAQLEQDVALIKRDLALPLAAAPHLGWLPVIGPTVSAGPTLFSIGESLLHATTAVWEVVGEPVCAAASGDAAPAQALASLQASMTPHQAELLAASAQVHAAMEQLDSIEADQLVPRLTGPLAQIQELSPLLTAAFDVLPLLPKVAAPSGEHAYLLLAQNNDELRATGGFISSIGVLSIVDGMPESFSLADSYKVENWKKPHPDPPEELRTYMGIDLWVTRDGNWWPDFPTSAEAVADLYTLNQDVPVDGVVAIDMTAATRLLEALTPLELSDGKRLEPGRVKETFRKSWSLPPGCLVTSGVVVTATRPFTSIALEISYSDKSGEAWFDTVKLEDLGQPGTNLVRNGSFEDDLDNDGVPDGWQASGLGTTDRLVRDYAHSGERSLFIVGEEGVTKTISQQIPVSGEAGTRLRISAESRSDNTVVAGGPYALTMILLDGEEEVQSVVAAYPVLTHDWATAGSSKILGAWWRHRKDFMNEALQAAMVKMVAEPSRVRWLDLLETGKDLLDERHIQLYMADPSLQELVQRYGWDGGMADTGIDYLMLVDSNMGYNKVTANIEQSIDYQVEIVGSRRERARLSVNYENRSRGHVEECDKFKQHVPTYDALTNGCYWDYVRVYVLAGATLTSTTGGDEAVEVFTEQGRTVFATYLILEPGEKRELVFEYDLPPCAVQDAWTYLLYVQKQAGTDAIPLRITVSGTGGLTVAPGSLAAEEETPERIVFQTDLLRDRQVLIWFP